MPQQTESPIQRYITLGLLCMLISTLSYAVSSVYVKLASVHVATNFILFFRYGFFFILLLPFFIRRPAKFKTQHGMSHAVRGLCGLLAISSFFYSIRFVPLTQAVLLSVSAPLFIPLVLRVTRGVKIIPQLYWGLAIGLVGVIIILQPSLDTFHFALLIALASAIFRAISSCGIRQIAKEDSTIVILFYYFLIGTVATGLSLFIYPQDLSGLPWFYLLIIGMTGAAYQIFLTLAYRLAPLRLMSPFTYLTVVFAAIADWLIWQEALSLSVFMGMMLVFIGAMLTIYMGQRHIT